VLQRFTGSDLFGARTTVPRGESFVEPGAVPAIRQVLVWPTFSAAVDEAGMSRRYGGIHFPDADLHGREMGRSIGQNAWVKAQTYIDGSAGG
jgi:hypothetical protein